MNTTPRVFYEDTAYWECCRMGIHRFLSSVANCPHKSHLFSVTGSHELPKIFKCIFERTHFISIR